MFDFDKYCLDGEEWKDIPNYEGLYQASSFGRIRTVDGKKTYSIRHGERTWKGRILKNKTKIPSKSGYKVTLWKDKTPKDILVARLVCSAFYVMPENKLTETAERITVNHKNGCRFDNRASNLEWMTLAENIRHAFETGLMTNQKSVRLISAASGDRIDFKSYSSAGRFLGRSHGYIHNVIVKKENTHETFLATDSR